MTELPLQAQVKTQLVTRAKEAVAPAFSGKAAEPGAVAQAERTATGLFDRLLSVPVTTEADAYGVVDLVNSKGSDFFNNLKTTKSMYGERIAAVRTQLEEEFSNGRTEARDELEILDQLEPAVSGAIQEHAAVHLKSQENRKELETALTDLAATRFTSRLLDDPAGVPLRDVEETYARTVDAVLADAGINQRNAPREIYELRSMVVPDIVGFKATQDGIDRHAKVLRIYAETQIARFQLNKSLYVERTALYEAYPHIEKIQARTQFSPQQQIQITETFLGVIEQMDGKYRSEITAKEWVDKSLIRNDPIAAGYRQLTSRLFEGLEFEGTIPVTQDLVLEANTQIKEEQAAFALGVGVSQVVRGESSRQYLTALSYIPPEQQNILQEALSDNFSRLEVSDPKRQALGEMLYLGHRDYLKKNPAVEVKVVELLGGQDEAQKFLGKRADELLVEVKSLVEKKAVNERNQVGRDSYGPGQLEQAWAEGNHYRVKEAMENITHKLIYSAGLARIIDLQ
ncbi:MAG: hypothetical protein AAB874_06645, partial [Patescibacteria group bacterium]